MALTQAQLATLKADILADPVLNAKANNSDGAFEIAAAYNLIAVPDFWVWRTAVTKHEITNDTSRNLTTFTWVGNGFITRSVGEQAAWTELFNSSLTINPSRPSVRQAFLDIFSGVGNAAANRIHLDTVARRKATRAQKLFATGTGLDTAVGSGTMTVENDLSFTDVQTARELP